MLCMIWGSRKCGKRYDMCGHEIWVMKEGSNWVQLCDIPVHFGYSMCCTHEGALFLTRDNIFIHNNEKGTIKNSMFMRFISLIITQILGMLVALFHLWFLINLR